MIPLSQPNEGAITFAEPNETVPLSERMRDVAVTAARVAEAVVTPQLAVQRITSAIGRDPQPYADLFSTAERQTMLVETVTSRNIATEQAYDRRIKSIKDATGIELENPLRGGYGDEIKRAARADIMLRGQSAEQEPAEPLTGGAIFERKLDELREKHPDKLDSLAFGDINAEAAAIAKGADAEYEAARKQPNLDPVASLVAQFGGAAWGMRRDPLFVGSLFAGPTTAVGKTVAGRIASAGLFQGLYNMGISALEQPVVQQWRAEIGLRSGIVPAAENVGLAFLFGAIPGAAFRGVHEIPSALRVPVQRVLDGVPQGGDIEKAMLAAKHALGEIDAEIPGLNRVQTSAIRLGEEMDAAEKITQPRAARDVSPQLHDDLTQSAQRYADDPINAPSPAGVAYIDAYHGTGSPEDFTVFDLNRPTTRGGFPRGSEEGVAFFSPTPGLANVFATGEHARVIPVKIAPGKTHTFDAVELWVKDEKFHDEMRRLGTTMAKGETTEADRASFAKIYEDRHQDTLRQYEWHTKGLEAAARAEGMSEAEISKMLTEREPFKLPLSTGAIAAIIERAKKMGLDTATITGMQEGDQIIVLNARNIRSRLENAEISERIAAAQPQNLAEAQKAASEAIEDIGNRETMARTRVQMDADRLPKPEPLPEGVEAPKPRKGDPMDQIPMARDDGTPTLVSARQAARAGERETQFADIIRECK